MQDPTKTSIRLVRLAHRLILTEVSVPIQDIEGSCIYVLRVSVLPALLKCQVHFFLSFVFILLSYISLYIYFASYSVKLFLRLISNNTVPSKSRQQKEKKNRYNRNRFYYSANIYIVLDSLYTTKYNYVCTTYSQTIPPITITDNSALLIVLGLISSRILPNLVEKRREYERIT